MLHLASMRARCCFLGALFTFGLRAPAVPGEAREEALGGDVPLRTSTRPAILQCADRRDRAWASGDGSRGVSSWMCPRFLLLKLRVA